MPDRKAVSTWKQGRARGVLCRLFEMLRGLLRPPRISWGEHRAGLVTLTHRTNV